MGSACSNNSFKFVIPAAAERRAGIQKRANDVQMAANRYLQSFRTYAQLIKDQKASEEKMVTNARRLEDAAIEIRPGPEGAVGASPGHTWIQPGGGE
jgi:hypothetical protein